jgi:hypothetical protein
MVQISALPKVHKAVTLQSLPFAAEYSAQHFFCSSCTSEDFSLNAPKFIFTGSNGVVTYNLSPISGFEMGALALFFKTAATFTRSIHFDHIPGFRISANVVDGTKVDLLFQADAELLHFMGHAGSANLASIQLTTSQLDTLADQILDSAATCN